MKNPIDMNGEPSQANQESTRAESADNRVAGWYRDLKQQLTSLEPYLKAGRMVTFQNITNEEKAFFEEVVTAVAVPESVCAVFIPPSIVQQAMWPETITGKTQSHPDCMVFHRTPVLSLLSDAGLRPPS